MKEVIENIMETQAILSERIDLVNQRIDNLKELVDTIEKLVLKLPDKIESLEYDLKYELEELKNKES